MDYILFLFLFLVSFFSTFVTINIMSSQKEKSSHTDISTLKHSILTMSIQDIIDVFHRNEIRNYWKTNE